MGTKQQENWSVMEAPQIERIMRQRKCTEQDCVGDWRTVREAVCHTVVAKLCECRQLGHFFHVRGAVTVLQHDWQNRYWEDGGGRQGEHCKKKMLHFGKYVCIKIPVSQRKLEQTCHVLWASRLSFSTWLMLNHQQMWFSLFGLSKRAQKVTHPQV